MSRPTTVFKTVALNHSAISPLFFIKKYLLKANFLWLPQLDSNQRPNG